MTNSPLKNKVVRSSVFIVCLLLVFYIGAEYLEGSDVALQNARPPWLLAALAVQILAMAAAALTWKIAVKKASEYSLAWRDSILHISLNLIAKYVPGKVWGLAARHGMLVSARVSHAKAAQALVYEQFSFLLTGTLLATPAFYIAGKSLFPWLSRDSVLLAAAILAAAILAVIVSWRLSVSLLLAMGRYRLLFVTSSLQWGADILSLFLVAHSLSIPLEGPDYLTLASALPAAVIAGMLAIFVPSGIGVREGALVLLCSPALGTDSALACAVLLRGTTTARDMIAGITAGLLAQSGQASGHSP